MQLIDQSFADAGSVSGLLNNVDSPDKNSDAEEEKIPEVSPVREHSDVHMSGGSRFNLQPVNISRSQRARMNQGQVLERIRQDELSQVANAIPEEEDEGEGYDWA